MKLLKFYADWCVPCKSFAPIIEKVTKELDIEVLSLNVGDDSDTKAQELKDFYNVRSIPTIVLINDDDLVKQNTGQMTEDQLREWLTVDAE